MDLFCSNCGNQLREGARFCNKCGKPVNTKSDNTFQNQQIQNYNQFQNGMNQIANPPYPNQYNQPNYGNNYPSYEYQQSNYHQNYTKEPLTWGTAIGNYWSCRFNGRCSRWEWWFTVLTFCIPFSILVNSGIFALTANNRTPSEFILGIIIFNLIVLIPNLSFTTRRLHDLNLSGLWQIIFFLPTIIGFFIGMSMASVSYSEAKNLLLLDQIIEFGGGFIVFIIGITWIFSDGTPGPNKYGPPSKY